MNESKPEIKKIFLLNIESEIFEPTLCEKIDCLLAEYGFYKKIELIHPKKSLKHLSYANTRERSIYLVANKNPLKKVSWISERMYVPAQAILSFMNFSECNELEEELGKIVSSLEIIKSPQFF